MALSASIGVSEGEDMSISFDIVRSTACALLLAAACSPAGKSPEEYDAAPAPDAAPRATDAGGPAPRQLEWTSPAPINPGAESSTCGAIGDAPEDSERWLVGWHSVLTLAHHANLWLVPAGTDIATWCKGHDQSTLLFDASQPDLNVRAPDGGAIRIPAGSTFAVDVHQLNTTDQPGTVRVHIDLDMVDEQPGAELYPGMLQAELFSVPAGASETLSWSCDVTRGATIAWISSHAHRFTDLFTVEADGAEVYRSTNWAEPAQTTYDQPLVPKVVTWSSHIVNTLTTTLKYGTPRDTAEMSIVWLYTFGARFDCENTHAVVN